MKPSARSLAAGFLWGLWGMTMYRWAPLSVLVGILVTGPFIGLSVWLISRWAYRSLTLIALWTVPSVYLATAQFGLVTGLLDGISRGREMGLEDFVAALWGISIPSPFWAIHPLAFLTHLWVRSGQPASIGVENTENAT
jgi:hypothetical protein